LPSSCSESNPQLREEFLAAAREGERWTNPYLGKENRLSATPDQYKAVAKQLVASAADSLAADRYSRMQSLLLYYGSNYSTYDEYLELSAEYTALQAVASDLRS
jgi:hypothetical protein